MKPQSKSIYALSAALCLSLFAMNAHAVEGPPTSSNGVIGDANLVRNSDIAKAQAVGAITSFMSKGAQECDADGSNCRSLFGADDTPDYTALKFRGQATTGTESYSFQTEGQDSGAVATQMGTLAVACGDTKVKQVAGLAIKVLSCAVQPSGNAKITVQVCTAPERSNPVTQPDNAVACSTNPKDANFTAPAGKVCIRPACDSEPLNSLNGWSSPKDISWDASMGDAASEKERSQNGLGLVFYPNPAAGTQLSFATDSDNMTAVKVIQSFINKDTGATAVGLRVAYRHKTELTKEMLTDTNSITNPSQHTAQWDTLTKLQSNAMIPQLQAKYAANGSECIQQITEGVASDGIVYVCEQGYNNEAGIRPLALSAQVAADGQECGSMPQCLQEVVNTNTWTETCQADVPLAMRDCTTTQDYTKDKISYTRTKTTEICHEKRLTAEYSCNTWAAPDQCRMTNVIGQGGMDMISLTSDTKVERISTSPDGLTSHYLYGTIGDNYWRTEYYKREFYVDIKDVKDVKTFRLYHVGFDDLMAIRINDVWIWKDYKEGFFNPDYDRWGRWKETRFCEGYQESGDDCARCAKYSEGGGDSGGYCLEWVRGDAAWTIKREWQSQWELETNWDYDVNVDFRPYLKEGRNVIRIDTGVVDKGEGWAYFEISAYKPECDVVIRNECTQYENAR